MKNKLKVVIISTSLVSGTISVSTAEEVPPGYVVNKSNVSKIDNQTFEKHNLGEMITPVMRKLIENNLAIKLASSKPVIVAPSLIDASKKYNGTVKYDRSTRKVSNYVAGIPFFNISDTDPDLAEKLVWNHFYGYASLTDVTFTSTSTYAIDSNKGIERDTSLVNSTLKLTHRNAVEPVAPKAIGDGGIYQKLLVFNLAPQDIAGTGAYVQRYDDGRVDDSWAYIKAIRRVRRSSGGTWMNPIPGTTLLNDESACMSAHPTWYPKYTFVKKQWVLAVVHSVPNGISGKLDRLDYKTAPYWNPIQSWEPREVYVIDITTPSAHPAGKRRVYYDHELSGFLMCDTYDKKGDLWKFAQMPVGETLLYDGQPNVGSNYVWSVDFQRMYATYVDSTFRHSNDERMDPNDWAPEGLAESSKFAIPALVKKYGPADWVELLSPEEKALRKSHLK